MDKTGNYQLCLWDAEDRILMGDFNEDNKTLDAALHAEKEARENAVAALNAAVEKCGNCKVVYGLYTGTGTYGKDGPTTLTFDHKPVMLAMMPRGGGTHVRRLWVVRDALSAHSMADTSDAYVMVSWGERSISFYNDSNPAFQYNAKDSVSCYVALLVQDE